MKPDDAAGIFDFSNLKILVVNDTHSYFNGTVEFKKDLRRPWVYRILAEKYHRGQWVVQAMDRRIADMCEKMHDPSELWYNIFKNVEKCPRPAGVSYKNKFNSRKIVIVVIIYSLFGLGI